MTNAEGERAGGRVARDLPLQLGERHPTSDHGGPDSPRGPDGGCRDLSRRDQDRSVEGVKGPPVTTWKFQAG
jgi:hypothetical protein